MSKSKGRGDEHGRECTECNTYKLWSEFYTKSTKSFSGRSRHMTKCKKCSNKMSCEWARLKKLNEAPREEVDYSVFKEEPVGKRPDIAPPDTDGLASDYYKDLMK